MSAIFLAAASLLSVAVPAHAEAAPHSQPEAVASADGVLRLQSVHDVDQTVARIRASVESKGIRYFGAIDQSELGANAGLPIGKSTLVLFGNPPLGVQFLRANPYAGLDWPVRMLVTTDGDGRVWISWTDFHFIAGRYRLSGLDAQLKMASEVAATIAAEAST